MSYTAPLDQLLTIGDVRDLPEDINYVERFQLDTTHIPELLRMMNDNQLDQADSESLEIWAPFHAWRALGQLDVGIAIDAMVDRIVADPFGDDWIHEDLIDLIKESGQPYISKIGQLIADNAADDYPTLTLIDSIGELGKNHPESRDECVPLLTQQLKKSASNSAPVNGFLVAQLLALKAVESIGVIESAYYLNHVDETICGNLKDVYNEFGIELPPPPTPPSRGASTSPFPAKPRKKFGKKHKPKK